MRHPLALLLLASALSACVTAPRQAARPSPPETFDPALAAGAERSWWAREGHDEPWRPADDAAVGLEEVQVRPRADGGADIEGVVTRREPGGRVSVFAASAEAPVRVLGHDDVDARIDPVPLTERRRLPFHIAVAPEGVEVLRDAEGRGRGHLFGVVTSEDGPAVLVVLRFTF